MASKERHAIVAEVRPGGRKPTMEVKTMEVESPAPATTKQKQEQKRKPNKKNGSVAYKRGGTCKGGVAQAYHQQLKLHGQTQSGNSSGRKVNFIDVNNFSTGGDFERMENKDSGDVGAVASSPRKKRGRGRALPTTKPIAGAAKSLSNSKKQKSRQVTSTELETEEIGPAGLTLHDINVPKALKG
jgi:hypothetical protein